MTVHKNVAQLPPVIEIQTFHAPRIPTPPKGRLVKGANGRKCECANLHPDNTTLFPFYNVSKCHAKNAMTAKKNR